jgi:phosphoglucomutase/phosphomannomutase
MYYEIGYAPAADLKGVKQAAEELLRKLETDFMTVCYQIIGVDFPKRGFLLFWQLPLSSKLKYFEIEDQIIALKDIPEKSARQGKLTEILAFLGSNPTQKVNQAFKDKFGNTIEKYLDLE